MDPATFQRVVEIILKEHPPEDWSRGMDPFEVLVSVVISQNTTVANERKALESLRREVGITPHSIARASMGDLERALRPAGLHRSKAHRLREIARWLLRDHDGDLRRILSLPLEEARAALLRLPGVGPKTADVVLSMAAGQATFPVDTHLWRIARRWELAEGRSYEEVRRAFEELIPPERRRRVHLSLIRFGRSVCRARRPRCSTCPVQECCPYFQRGL
jgi:endonuclease III